MTIRELINLMMPMTLDHQVYIVHQYDAFEDCLVFEDPATHKQCYIELDRPDATLKQVPSGYEVKEIPKKVLDIT